MTFIDHCQVPLGTGEHIIVFVILDGATTLLTVEAVTTTQEVENITVFRNYFDQYHLGPKSVVVDQAFMTREHFYQSLDITPISLGPNTPWPNRAEAAVRLLKAQLKIMLRLRRGPPTHRPDACQRYTDRNHVDQLCKNMTDALLVLYSSKQESLKASSTSALVGKKRKEATATEIKAYQKQFLEAKQLERKSWLDNEVFDLVDTRKIQVRNWVTARWALTLKQDKDGNFLKTKACWVLQRFQDKQKNDQQTDSPAVSRSGLSRQPQ